MVKAERLIVLAILGMSLCACRRAPNAITRGPNPNARTSNRALQLQNIDPNDWPFIAEVEVELIEERLLRNQVGLAEADAGVTKAMWNSVRGLEDVSIRTRGGNFVHLHDVANINVKLTNRAQRQHGDSQAWHRNMVPARISLQLDVRKLANLGLNANEVNRACDQLFRKATFSLAEVRAMTFHTKAKGLVCLSETASIDINLYDDQGDGKPGLFENKEE